MQFKLPFGSLHRASTHRDVLAWHTECTDSSAMVLARRGTNWRELNKPETRYRHSDAMKPSGLDTVPGRAVHRAVTAPSGVKHLLARDRAYVGYTHRLHSHCGTHVIPPSVNRYRVKNRVPSEGADEQNGESIDTKLMRRRSKLSR